MIELFRGDLVSFSKEKIDIALIRSWLRLHNGAKDGYLYLFFREHQIWILVVNDQISVLVVFVPVVVLEVIERMVVPDPSFDHHTLIPLCDGLEEVPDLWGDLLVDQVV